MEDGKTSAGILMQTHCSVLPMRANPRTLGVKCNGFPVYKKTDFHSKSSFFVLGFWRKSTIYITPNYITRNSIGKPPLLSKTSVIDRGGFPLFQRIWTILMFFRAILGAEMRKF